MRKPILFAGSLALLGIMGLGAYAGARMMAGRGQEVLAIWSPPG